MTNCVHYQQLTSKNLRGCAHAGIHTREEPTQTPPTPYCLHAPVSCLRCSVPPLSRKCALGRRRVSGVRFVVSLSRPCGACVVFSVPAARGVSRCLRPPTPLHSPAAGMTISLIDKQQTDNIHQRATDNVSASAQVGHFATNHCARMPVNKKCSLHTQNTLPLFRCAYIALWHNRRQESGVSTLICSHYG